MAGKAPSALGNSAAVEDYLERILELINTKGYARVVDIATSLKISQASVTNMVQRLDAEGLLKYEKYRGLVLTTAGETLARNIAAASAADRFLQLLGLDERVIEHDVEGMEHHISPATLRAIEALTAQLRRGPHWSRSLTRRRLVRRDYPHAASLRAALVLAIDIGSSSHAARHCSTDSGALVPKRIVARSDMRSITPQTAAAELDRRRRCSARPRLHTLSSRAILPHGAKRSDRRREPAPLSGTACSGSDRNGRPDDAGLHLGGLPQRSRTLPRCGRDLSEREIQLRTGCMLRAPFWPAKLALAAAHAVAALFRRIARWVSPAAWILRGSVRRSTRRSHSMASGTGLYNLRAAARGTRSFAICCARRIRSSSERLRRRRASMVGKLTRAFARRDHFRCHRRRRGEQSRIRRGRSPGAIAINIGTSGGGANDRRSARRTSADQTTARTFQLRRRRRRVWLSAARSATAAICSGGVMRELQPAERGVAEKCAFARAQAAARSR